MNYIFKEIKNVPRIITICTLGFVLLSSCSSDNDEPDVPLGPTPQIIVLYGPGGLGDQGYNDCILAGIQNFKKAHHDDVDMYHR